MFKRFMLLIAACGFLQAAEPFVEVLLYPSRDTLISSPVQGLLVEHNIQEGQTVDKGLVLARLDDREEQFEIKRLQKVVEKKNFDCQGFQNLLKDNMTSKNEAMQANLEKELVELELQRAKMRMQLKTLRSPIKGQVVKVHYDSGEWVRTGEALFQIIDTDKIHAVALLNMEQASLLSKDMRVRIGFENLIFGIKSGLSIKHVLGKVIFIDPRFDLSSGLKKVKIEIDNQDFLLKPGMRGKLDLSRLGK